MPASSAVAAAAPSAPSAPSAAGTGFRGLAEPSLERFDEMLEQLCELCSGRCEGVPRLPERLLGKQPFQDKARALLAWALDWAGTRADAVQWDEDAAEALHMQRLLHWKRFHALCPLESTAKSLVKDGRQRKLFYSLRVLELIWNLQDNAFMLWRLLTNRDDASVRSTALSHAADRYLGTTYLDKSEENGKKKKERDCEEIVVYLLNIAAQKGYRKRGGIVYEERTVWSGGMVWGTRAWTPADLGSQRGPGGEGSSIATFVYASLTRETRPDLWSKFLEMRGSVRIFTYLECCEDVQFPFLVPCRNILAFKNGILDTAHLAAERWAERQGLFYPYPEVARHFDSSVVACKFFDMDIEPDWMLAAQEDRWQSIPTPKFQQVLDYQRFGKKLAAAPPQGHGHGHGGKGDGDGDGSGGGAPRLETYVSLARKFSCEMDVNADKLAAKLRAATPAEVPDVLRQLEHDMERMLAELGKLSAEAAPSAADALGSGDALPPEVQRWVYVFMGRMLHDLHVNEAWQIIPFIKGRAGSGKSIVAHVVRNFFAAEDVGVLSNNVEKKFGLMSLCDKFAFVCFEMKKSMQLDQAEFQSIVSGEDVSVAVKNKGTHTLRWKAPGLLCGNEGPGYVDAQGSIARRLAVMNFRHGIADRDSEPGLLEEILTKELGALVVKCNAAYLAAARDHRRQDIWSVLPPYFREERRGLQKDTDALFNVIWDETTFDLALRDKKPAKEYWTPFEVVEEAYRSRWRDVHGTMFADALTADKYATPFADAQLEVVSATLPWANEPREGKFVLGIRPRLKATARPAHLEL